MELSHWRFWVKDFPFYGRDGCNSYLTSRVSIVDHTELDNGQPVRSRRREYGCRRRWRSGITMSYVRDTDANEVQLV
jgi:hypothetical protein